MNLLKSLSLIAGTAALIATNAFASPIPSTLDDFSDEKQSALKIDRMFIDDTTAGGKTSTSYTVSNGILSAKGDIAPPRGQPGWASAIFLLQAEGQGQDLSQYEGILIKIRIKKGNISISANSAEIVNFDYHAAQIVRKSGKEFQEVKIPFASMKRAWSEQTKLNKTSIVSLSLVAFDLQAGSFDFEVDEISFY